MNDTPRTDDRAVIIDENPWVNAPFARQLERELNAANDRIKRMEDRVHRAANAFFADASDKYASVQMLAILEEERNKP